MTTVADMIKKLRPNIKSKTLKNYVSSYNVCQTFFKDSNYFKKPKEVIKFYKDRYPKVTTRKTNLHAQALIARAYNHLGSEKIFLKQAEIIQDKLNKEKEKKIKVAMNKPTVNKINVESSEITNFELVIKVFKDQEKKVMEFYKPKKLTYTIKELKEIYKKIKKEYDNL